MFQFHASEDLLPPNSDQPARIDAEMTALVRALWAKGWQTTACCQDAGEATEAERAHGNARKPTGHHGFIEYHRGWAWLKMPTADALCLLTELAAHETFAEHVKTRWQHGSWRMHIPVIHEDGSMSAAPHVQIYFPNSQITELTSALTSLGQT